MSILSFLGLLGGGLFRILPQFINLFQDWSDKKHELKMMEIQVESSEKLAKLKSAMLAANLDVKAQDRTYTHFENIQKGVSKRALTWQSMTQSNIAYLLLAGYIAAKIISWVILFATPFDNMPLFVLSPAIFNSFDEVLLGSVVGFYFTGRALK